MRLDGRLRPSSYLLVRLEHRIGNFALALAVEACRCDVRAVRAEALRDVRECPALVVLPHDDARALPGDAHVDTVDATNHRRSAADALAADAHLDAIGIDDEDIDGVGMIVVVGFRLRLERKGEPPLFSQSKRIANAGVVRGEPQHARNEGFVRAVPERVWANDPRSANEADTGSAKHKLRAMEAMRSAPAV